MELHYGEPQAAVAVVFAVLAAAIAAVLVVVALQTRREVPFERVREVAYAIRRWWFGILLVALVAIVGGSLLELPYSSGAARDATLVRVVGGQFYWSLNPTRVRVGSRVRFDVTSADVNHGMGLYAPDGTLIGSVQAMPGFHNKLDLTLDHKGTYLISCLEYCGARHHLMTRRLDVVGG